MTIQPFRGVMLGKLIDEPSETKSGLHMVRIKKELQRQARIIAVGTPARGKKGKRIALYADVGETVYIKRHAGQPFELDGMKLIFLYNDDIVAKYR